MSNLDDLLRRDDDPLLRPREAAKRLGVCVETLRRWMRKGVLAFERVGPHKRVRIRLSQIEAQRERGTAA